VVGVSEAGAAAGEIRRRRARRRLLVSLTLAVLLLAVGVGVGVVTGGSFRAAAPVQHTCRPPSKQAVRALDGVRTWEYHHKSLSDGTVIRARAARWQGVDPYALDIGGGSALCLAGGRVQGSWPADTSWKTMHGTAGVIVDGAPHATIEDLRVDGYGDSIRIVDDSPNFLLRRVHLSYSRDDCVENDWLNSGTVQDSLLDGCYNAFSARTYHGQSHVTDGSGNLWTIENTLVRLQPMPQVYKDRGRVPGTAGFFKWDKDGPRLSLVNDVFRADQPADTVGLGIPAGKLSSCRNNVMVWLGRGPYPAPLPSCFSVTTDEAVWNRAVARWKQDHNQ